MTIKDRMQMRFHMNGEPHVEHRYYETYKECIAVATEQDQISRQEERERCINDVCAWIDNNMDAAPGEVDYFIKELRKAIKEGGNNE